MVEYKRILTCPYCMDNTCCKRLECNSKQVGIRHDLYLEQGHGYRSDRRSFNGITEMRDAPKLLISTENYEHV